LNALLNFKTATGRVDSLEPIQGFCKMNFACDIISIKTD